MGYNEFDELGDKIQSIIDSAVNEKNYQKLSQSINQALNKAIDNGSDALRDALNNTVGSGKYTNYRSGSSYDYRENRSWDFQKDGKKNRSTGEDHGTGYQGYAGAKGNDLRKETSREMVQAGRIPITRIRIWRCIYRRMESRSGEF